MNEKVILLTFLDKLMFWKKKEEPIPDLPPDFVPVEESSDEEFTKAIHQELGKEEKMVFFLLLFVSFGIFPLYRAYQHTLIVRYKTDDI